MLAESRIGNSLRKAETFLMASRLSYGWGYEVPSTEHFIEPSTWCILFINRIGGETRVDLDWLVTCQNPDGGWPELPGGPSNIRTANALLALRAGDHEGRFLGVRRAGEHWLLKHRSITGGWSSGSEISSFVESTSLAISAMGQKGLLIDPRASALYLLSFQEADGAWRDPSVVVRNNASTTEVCTTAWALVGLRYLGFDTEDLPVRAGIGFITTLLSDLSMASPLALALCLRTLIMFDLDYNLQKEWAHSLVRLQEVDGSWRRNTLVTAMAGLALSLFLRRQWRDPSDFEIRSLWQV